MSYARRYSLPEVRAILAASEGRERPDRPGGPKGHAMGQHTLARPHYFGRRAADGEPVKKDSTLLVPPARMAEFVHEALNSVPGQRALVKLDDPRRKRVEFDSVLIRRRADFDIFVVYQPEGQQTWFDWASVVRGDGIILVMRVVVFSIPASVHRDVHIHTAYPSDFARLDGDQIVRARPVPA